MKNYLKETWYMYIISFVFCFMLFFFEPIMMYLGNVSDFWFGISTIIKMSLSLFLIFYIACVVIFNIIYFISKKAFNILIVLFFIVFICSYIQGNYLIGNLPVLDGTPIVWSSNKIDWLISGLLWLIVIGAVYFITKKVTIKKIVKYASFVSLAVFVMISLSLVISLVSSGDLTGKEYVPFTTYKNINKYSDNKNFIILVLDSVDSGTFNRKMNEDKDFNNLLHDFTYYPDTMSAHPYTTESLPLMLTGKLYKNDEPILKWTTDAYKESSLLKLLEDNEYDINLYESELFYYDKGASRISNVYGSDNHDKLINVPSFWNQELKYISFKYLPSFFKRFSKIDDMYYNPRRIFKKIENLDDRFFDTSDLDLLNIIKENTYQKVDENVFKFIHVEGAHVPFKYDKNFNIIKNGTYEDGVLACLTLTKEYLNKLKENGVYDNSAIIIMADHGYTTKENDNQRQNPILYVKGFKETHDTMQTSNKPVHFIDLEGLYKDLVAGKKSSEVFKDIPNERTRTFMYYKLGWDHMIEYETTGTVLDKEKQHKTGKEYYKKR